MRGSAPAPWCGARSGSRVCEKIRCKQAGILLRQCLSISVAFDEAYRVSPGMSSGSVSRYTRRGAFHTLHYSPIISLHHEICPKMLLTSPTLNGSPPMADQLATLAAETGVSIGRSYGYGFPVAHVPVLPQAPPSPEHSKVMAQSIASEEVDSRVPRGCTVGSFRRQIAAEGLASL